MIMGEGLGILSQAGLVVNYASQLVEFAGKRTFGLQLLLMSGEYLFVQNDPDGHKIEPVGPFLSFEESPDGYRENSVSEGLVADEDLLEGALRAMKEELELVADSDRVIPMLMLPTLMCYQENPSTNTGVVIAGLAALYLLNQEEANYLDSFSLETTDGVRTGRMVTLRSMLDRLVTNSNIGVIRPAFADFLTIYSLIGMDTSLRLATEYVTNKNRQLLQVLENREREHDLTIDFGIYNYLNIHS